MPGAGGKIFCERKNVVKITLTQHLIRKSANQEAGQDWTCERPPICHQYHATDVCFDVFCSESTFRTRV